MPSTHLLTSRSDFNPYTYLGNDMCSVGFLRPGMQVVVRDHEGALLGSDFISARTYSTGSFTSVYRCRVTWSVTVPDRSFYQVEMAGQSMVHSRADLEAAGWKLVAVSSNVPLD